MTLMQNHKLLQRLKYLSLISGSLFLAACNNGDSTSSSSSPPLSGNYVQVTTLNDKIMTVSKFLANSKAPTLVIYPHGINYARSNYKAKNITNHYYSTMDEYEEDKVNIDSSYQRIKALKSSNSAIQNTSSLPTSAYGIEIGYVPSSTQTVSGSGDIYNPEKSNIPDIPASQLTAFSGQPVCYNFTGQVQTSAANGGHSIAANFINTKSDSSFANVLNTSANVSASVGLFKANASVKYDTNYQGSSFGNTISFFAYDATNASFALNGLSPMGLYLLANYPQAFQQQCGTNFISTADLGVAYGVSLTATAINSSSQQSVNSQISASYTFASVSASIGTSNSNTSANYSLSATFIQDGDYIFTHSQNVNGTIISAGSTFEETLHSWENTQIATNGGMSSCTASMTPSSSNTNGTNCSQFLTNLSNEISYLMTAVNADMTASDTISNDMSLFDVFTTGISIPQGPSVAPNFATIPLKSSGVIQQQLSAYESSAQNNQNLIFDRYGKYAQALQDQVKLMWQINSLYNRVLFISGLSTNVNYPNNYNSLSNLAASYNTDFNNLQTALNACLAESRDCYRLAGEATAYGYYYQNRNSTTDPLAADKLWNTIFLQYQPNYAEVVPLSETNSPAYGYANYQVSNNAATMGLYYASNNNLSLGQQPGLVAFTTTPLQINNPVYNVTNGAGRVWGDLESYPLAGGFLLNYPVSNPDSFLNSYTAGSSLSGLFASGPLKFAGAPAAETPDSVAAATNYPIATDSFNLNPKAAALSTFGLQVSTNSTPVDNYYGVFVFTTSGGIVLANNSYNAAVVDSTNMAMGSCMPMPTLNGGYTANMCWIFNGPGTNTLNLLPITPFY